MHRTGTFLWSFCVSVSVLEMCQVSGMGLEPAVSHFSPEHRAAAEPLIERPVPSMEGPLGNPAMNMGAI